MKVSFSNCNYGEIDIFLCVDDFLAGKPDVMGKASLWRGKDREAGKPKNDKKNNSFEQKLMTYSK